MRVLWRTVLCVVPGTGLPHRFSWPSVDRLGRANVIIHALNGRGIHCTKCRVREYTRCVSAGVRPSAYLSCARYLLGSVGGGYIMDRFDGNKSMSIAMACAGLGYLIIPFVSHVWTLAVLVSASGVAMGFVDTSANVLLLWIHKDKVGPYMQAMHFCFALGAFASPLAIRLAMGVSNNQYRGAFWAFGVACIALSVPLCFLRSTQHGSRPGSDEAGRDGNLTVSSRVQRRREWLLILCAAAVLFVYVGLETGYGGYVVTYVVKSDLHLEQAKGQYLTGVYWGAIALGRGISVWAATKFTPAQMLVCSVTGSCGSAFLMLMLHSVIAAQWVGAAVFGLCMACIFPTVIALAESSMHVQGRHASVFVVGAAVGEMIIPFSVAASFDSVGPVSFLAIIAAGSVLQVLALCAMMWQGRRVRQGILAPPGRSIGRIDPKRGLEDIGSDHVELVDSRRRSAASDGSAVSSGTEHPPEQCSFAIHDEEDSDADDIRSASRLSPIRPSSG